MRIKSAERLIKSGTRSRNFLHFEGKIWKTARCIIILIAHTRVRPSLRSTFERNSRWWCECAFLAKRNGYLLFFFSFLDFMTARALISFFNCRRARCQEHFPMILLRDSSLLFHRTGNLSTFPRLCEMKETDAKFWM